MKSRLELGDVINVSIDENGKAEYMNITKGAIQGPYTVRDAEWSRDVGGEAALNGVVMRDGKRAAPSDIAAGDIVYYSGEMNMLLVYTKKTTGVYEKAVPNKDTPASVVVSGVTYQIVSTDAFNRLSSGGPFEIGDAVTLLFGKDGRIAGVAAPSSLSAAADGAIVAYITATGKKEFENAKGQKYSSYYIQAASADGEAAEYPTLKDYKDYKNRLANVKLEDGKAVVGTQRSQSKLSGTVNANALALGGEKLASDVRILDVILTDASRVGGCNSVFLASLDGMTLRSEHILYAEKNARGEIQSLFLNDYTGELYSYGVVKGDYSTKSGSVVAAGYAFYFSGAQTATVQKSQQIEFGVIAGPVRVLMNGTRPDSVRQLTAVKEISQMTELELKEKGGETFPVPTNAAAFLRDFNGDYASIPYQELLDNPDAYGVSAYYDKAAQYGGRIRVLVATKK
jgi:hypothetical protein